MLRSCVLSLPSLLSPSLPSPPRPPQELNVRELTVASNESEYGVSLKAEPDPIRLGRRLKGDFKKVSERVKNLTDEELRQFQANGEMVVEGHTLDSDDVKVGGRV